MDAIRKIEAADSEAADARREIGKWLNEEPNRPVDREALAQLCAGFDALARPQEVGQPFNLEEIIDRYVDDYEMYAEDESGRDGYYAPNEHERHLLKDAIMGMLADPDWDAAWGEHITALAASRAPEVVRSEPVAYQARTRATWRNLGEGWTEWENCSAESYADYNKKPILHDWQYETRALYTAPQSTASLKDGEIAKVVNALRDVAVEFHGAQQLRERIAGIVVPLLKATQAQPSPRPADCEPVAQQFYCNKCGYAGQDQTHRACDYFAAPVTAPPSTAPAAEQGASSDSKPVYRVHAFSCKNRLGQSGNTEAKSRCAVWCGDQSSCIAALRLIGTTPNAEAQPVQQGDAKDAIADIVAERARQISCEGWTPEHDDEHTESEMALAAASYALSAGGYAKGQTPPIWPWALEWWKPAHGRRDLVRSGALIIAEIERLDRAAILASTPSAVSGGGES